MFIAVYRGLLWQPWLLNFSHAETGKPTGTTMALLLHPSSIIDHTVISKFLKHYLKANLIAGYFLSFQVTLIHECFVMSEVVQRYCVEIQVQLPQYQGEGNRGAAKAFEWKAWRVMGIEAVKIIIKLCLRGYGWKSIIHHHQLCVFTKNTEDQYNTYLHVYYVKKNYNSETDWHANKLPVLQIMPHRSFKLFTNV